MYRMSKLVSKVVMC